MPISKKVLILLTVNLFVLPFRYRLDKTTSNKCYLWFFFAKRFWQVLLIDSAMAQSKWLKDLQCSEALPSQMIAAAIYLP